MVEPKTENALSSLLTLYSEMDKPPIIELQNIDHNPVAALYLERIRGEKIVISETNNQERFYLYVNGVGIYFSFYKKINQK